MTVTAVFMEMGLVMGDFEEQMDGSYLVKKPVLIVTQQNNAALIPFLGMMEEQEISVKAEDCFFGRTFTPAVEVRNHYNQLFGTGIVEAKTELTLK